MYFIALTFAADANWMFVPIDLTINIKNQYQLDLPDVTSCSDRNNGSKEQKKKYMFLLDSM